MMRMLTSAYELAAAQLKVRRWQEFLYSVPSVELSIITPILRGIEVSCSAFSACGGLCLNHGACLQNSCAY
jgi:hypothetical protein